MAFPNGARVGHKTCTECGGRVVETHAYEEVALMRDPPHQVERFQRHTRWQCMNVEKHHGEYSAAAETRGGLAAWEIAEGA